MYIRVHMYMLHKISESELDAASTPTPRVKSASPPPKKICGAHLNQFFPRHNFTHPICFYFDLYKYRVAAKFGNQRTNFSKFNKIQIKNKHFPLNNTRFSNLCYLVEINIFLRIFMNFF